MKTYFSILLIAVCISITVSVQAQNKIGIRAGYQSSTWHKDGSQLAGSDANSSFYAGLFKEKKLIPLLHLGFGLEYLQNGAKLAGDNKQVINYLGIPVYLKAKVGPFYALTGLGLNIKLSEKYFEGDNSVSVPEGSKTKGVDYPFILGAGFKILMFSIEARYHWGLGDINNGITNQYLQVGAALSL